MSRLIIYGLVDPRTGAVRYIGKSKSGLLRPRQHGTPRALRAETHKSRWIRALLEAGHAYEIRVLEAVHSANELTQAEIRWIAQGRALGWPLTNMTDGGEGTGGLPMTDERRAKHAAGRRGKTHTVETRERLSAMKKGKPLSQRAHEAARNKNIGSTYNLGRRHGDETRRRMAESARLAWKLRTRLPRLRLNLMGDQK